MFSLEKQQQFFQAALIIVGMTCLLSSPRQSTGARASNAINTQTATTVCSQDLRVVQVSADAMLNLRAKPNGNVRDQLSAGKSVYVESYDRSGTWAKISADGQRGWVSTQYLSAAPGCPNHLG